MIHRISIRDLNTLGNLLPKDVSFKEPIQNMVLEAVAAKQTYILFDDNDKVDSIILEGIRLAKIQEHTNNNTRNRRRR